MYCGKIHDPTIVLEPVASAWSALLAEARQSIVWNFYLFYLMCDLNHYLYSKPFFICFLIWIWTIVVILIVLVLCDFSNYQILVYIYIFINTITHMCWNDAKHCDGIYIRLMLPRPPRLKSFPEWNTKTTEIKRYMLEIRGMITEIKQYNTTIPFEDLYYCKIWGVYVRASLYIQVWGGLRRSDPAIAVCCYVVCFCEIRSVGVLAWTVLRLVPVTCWYI
jgi:hypothetical protein